MEDDRPEAVAVQLSCQHGRGGGWEMLATAGRKGGHAQIPSRQFVVMFPGHNAFLGVTAYTSGKAGHPQIPRLVE